MLRFKNVSNLPCMKEHPCTGIEEKWDSEEGFYWSSWSTSTSPLVDHQGIIPKD